MIDSPCGFSPEEELAFNAYAFSLQSIEDAAEDIVEFARMNDGEIDLEDQERICSSYGIDLGSMSKDDFQYLQNAVNRRC